MRQKRDVKLCIRMSEDERKHLDELVKIYSFDGAVASQSFLVRYALKRLPHQPAIPVAA